MIINSDFLQFDYEKDDRIYDVALFLKEQGSEPFDKHSSKQMVLMMNYLGSRLNLDEYAMKRLEVLLKTDLPFFTTNRRLVYNWVSENFLY